MVQLLTVVELRVREVVGEPDDWDSEFSNGGQEIRLSALAEPKHFRLLSFLQLDIKDVFRLINLYLMWELQTTDNFFNDLQSGRRREYSDIDIHFGEGVQYTADDELTRVN